MLKTPIGRKVEWLLNRPDINAEKVRLATGVKGTSSVHEWKRTGRMAKQHIPVLAALSGTREAWWLTDDAPVPPTAEWLANSPQGASRSGRVSNEAVAYIAPSGEASQQAHELSLAPGEMWLPRHDGVYPRMGRGGMDDGQEVVTLVRVSIEGFKRQLGAARVTSLNALRLVTAFGDSMRPTFDDGDMLVIDTGVQAVGQDGVYLLRGPDDILVKRVQRKSDGAWLLISSNKEYETERIEPDRRDEFAVLGRVVFAWKGAVV